MPVAAPPLLQIFRSRLQGELLALILVDPARSWTIGELSQRTGSWAARYEGKSGPTPNDIDVLVVGEPNRDEIYEAAERAQRRLGREVNVTLRTRETWESGNDGFIQQVRVSPLVELPYPQDHATVEQRKRGRGASAKKRRVRAGAR